MKTITIPARLNGSHVDPIEPIEIPANAKIFILIATPEKGDDPDEDFRTGWHTLSALGLSRAYGDNEPDYDNVMVREPNAEYGKR